MAIQVEIDIDDHLDRGDSIIIEDDLEDKNSVYQNVSFINEYSSSVLEEVSPSINAINNNVAAAAAAASV